MAEQKTKPTEESVIKFLEDVEDEKKRKDSYHIVKLMQAATGQAPKMWGTNIVGFGSYHYKYNSGHEGVAPLVGFSPRKQSISLYLMAGFTEHENLLEQLGKHKVGKGCLYISKLEDVNIKVLSSLIKNSVEFLQKKYS
ncbi:MAG TPA: DUF1801 domain-containing protein [Cytophagales bacterium]|nr:DUF1801 domain-containing protein [Cytophagales bacterium]